MWGKSKPNPKATSIGRFDTLISNRTRIEGDIHFTGGLHIDGKVVGTVRADHDSDAVVRISDLGEIVGDLVAPHVVVNGKIHGNVYASKHVELAPKASIQGNVYYNLIEMAMGSEVNGSLVHNKDAATSEDAAEAAVDCAPAQLLEATPAAAEANDEQVIDMGENVRGRLRNSR